MFEKIKNIYKKIIKFIIPKNKVHQLNNPVHEEIKKDYKKEFDLYPIDEKNALKILEEIKKENHQIDIDLEDINKNYNIYKSIQEDDKIKWFKMKNDDIPLDEFIEIINTLSKKDVEILQHDFMVPIKMLIEAIHAMGTEQFIKLKTNNEFHNFMKMENYIKIITQLTKEEKQQLLSFRRNDLGQEVINRFYLYYHIIKTFKSDKINMMIINSKDKVGYINGRINDKQAGYKWTEDVLLMPIEYEMVAVEKIDTNLVLDIREKFNIPLNIIILGMVELDLIENNIERKELEKILLNYYKLNLNVCKQKDIDQLKNILLSLPENLDEENETIIRESIIGKFKKFEFQNYEQIKDYKKICDEKILQKFEKTDDINILKTFIFETKINDLDAIKRDIYFYKKYMSKEEFKEEIVLFEKLLATNNKEELLDVYIKINNMSTEFNLDDALINVRKTLEEISKEDVISKMNEMKEKIENGEKKSIDNQEIIDLTGKEFNLLISVIGSSGSPYLVEYHNKMLGKLRKRQNSKFINMLKKKTYLQIKIGIKRLVNKRYKLDPLKNKQRCVSSIDQDFLGHIKSENYSDDECKQIEEKLVLAYFPKNEKDIYWMGNQDLMTIYDKPRNDSTRKRIPHKDNIKAVCNLKLKDLNAMTLGEDNELVIDSYPEAVMCFDKISDIAKKTAKRLNIPILYINTKEQFRIIKSKTDKYNSQVYEQITQKEQISERTFQNTFNVFEQDNNIIHRAFKIANGFTFLDNDEYPQEEIAEIFNNMTSLVGETLKRCDENQREAIETIMKKEADLNLIRYGNYNDFIDLKELIALVSNTNDIEQSER